VRVRARVRVRVRVRVNPRPNPTLNLTLALKRTEPKQPAVLGFKSTLKKKHSVFGVLPQRELVFH